MPRRVALFVVLVFLGACVSPRVSTAVRPAYLDAVRPLQVEQAEVSEETLAVWYAHGWPQTNETYMNICTASSINIEKHYWLTAAHCMVNIGPEGRYIQGLPAKPVDVQTELDLAVFEVPGLVARGELTLSSKALRWQDEILMAGHPFGYPDVFVTRGYVANPSAMFSGKLFMIFDIAGAPGNSGSPVMSLRGELISVLQIGWGESFAPVCGGAITTSLNTLARYFAKVS